MVAKVSANGDEDMAEAVIKAFELIGYGDASHVTIKEVSGPYGYEVSQIEGFPVPIGYEESIGKFHTAFINDQSNQRCHLESPLFLLFDGQIVDLMTISEILERTAQAYVNGQSEYKNLVIFAHGFSDAVLTQLAFNFANPSTINVVPMVTPLAGFTNSQLHFLNDLAAFTGARVFGMKDSVAQATLKDLGAGMAYFEAYRFRSTIVGDPDPTNIEVRADQLKTQLKSSESQAERRWLEERLGKLTSGIAKLTIYGGSNGELKEAHDRCEDAVCAVRSAISKGVLPGGGRTLLDLSL
jgi:chaperonin GroEL